MEHDDTYVKQRIPIDMLRIEFQYLGKQNFNQYLLGIGLNGVIALAYVICCYDRSIPKKRVDASENAYAIVTSTCHRQHIHTGHV
jgi:hypothetical protein